MRIENRDTYLNQLSGSQSASRRPAADEEDSRVDSTGSTPRKIDEFITDLLRDVRNEPDVRSERIAAVREQFDNGEYQTLQSAVETADALVASGFQL
ncbi:MAG: flagellar biosynthesis anti-sigma factor FlgM [Planctomycetales bacterium]|nr:flagellar biosynthesis anti-sigma factor FlgM [Planctomycetales bacterium]